MVKPKPDDELVFLPLGGSNEIGMNFNLYGYGPPHDRKWVVVDLGVTFGDQTTPGVEVILPDPEFIEEHAHRIPEPNGLAIKTPLGTILHTGDWKIDPDPLLGGPTDEDAIRRLGDDGVLAMVCDSTNVFVDGRAGSEAEVRDKLVPLIGQLKGKVAVACFASNVARMDSMIRAAEANGRRVCLVGRSMHRMAAAAKSVGLMQDVKPFLDDTEAKHFPGEQVLFLCTGSQGEPRAALSRIADGTHPHVKLGAGDSCLFSSRVIPGNEIPIRNLQNK